MGPRTSVHNEMGMVTMDLQCQEAHNSEDCSFACVSHSCLHINVCMSIKRHTFVIWLSTIVLDQLVSQKVTCWM